MSTLPINKPTPRRQQIAPALPIKQASAEFDELALFFENQPPELRFLSTGVAKLDALLGGRGLPSSGLTHWRAPHVFAADALLLEVCRAACERGERVCLVDAANRFDAEVLQVAGLDVFDSQGLFERLSQNTFPAIAPRVDAWRRGEARKAPELLVVDSLVAMVESKIAGDPICSNRIERDTETARQGRMFYRLLVTMKGLAFRRGTAVLLVETPLVETPPLGKRSDRSQQREKCKLSTKSLKRVAFNTLRNHAKVHLSFRSHQENRDIICASMNPNRLAPEGGSAQINVRSG